MVKIYRNIIVGFIFLTLSSRFCFAVNFEIRGDKFYLDGKPFFINAVGYAPWRAGQWPGTDNVNIDIIEYDFKLIKEAGFNTIRTWEFLNEEELALASKYGLYVIQGIWLDPNVDFSDKVWQGLQIEKIRRTVKYSKNFPNVLFYLIMTEPTTEAVLYNGKSTTIDFFKKIISIVRDIDDKPISMDSWIPLGFLDHSIWDIITFNVFMFVPESINKVMGFEGYIRFIKENYAKNKPLFVGETGGFSVSKNKKNDIGFGGNSEEEQSLGNIRSIKACIKAGVAGVTTVVWVDTWHYPYDPDVHDDEPWEWDGIIALEDIDDPYGRPRKVFYDLKKFHEEFSYVSRDYRAKKSEIKLNIIPIKDIFDPDEKVRVVIKATVKDRPLPDTKIKYGFFIEQRWQEYIGEAVTDKNGEAQIDCKLNLNERIGYVLAFAALDNKKNIATDLKFIRVKFKKSSGKLYR